MKEKIKKINIEEHEARAEFYKVLANPKRLAILGELKGSELSVDEIAKRTGFSRTNVSQHLMQMRRFKLLKTRREGTNVFYRVSKNEIYELRARVDSYLKSLEK